MPHPSNPVDDIRVRPSYRELWPCPSGRGLEDVWLVSRGALLAVALERVSGLNVSLMDYFLVMYFVAIIPIKYVGNIELAYVNYNPLSPCSKSYNTCRREQA